jgi:hypothetical protein
MSKSQELHEADPVRGLLARAAEQPNAPESRTLVKAVLSLITHEDTVSVGELCALSADALDLIEAFVQAYTAGRYDREFLQRLSGKLQSDPSAQLAAAA